MTTLAHRDQPASPPLLSVTGVGVRFGHLIALDDVDLQVREGEIIALAGDNGAGKTTLVRVISGDIAPSAGTIILDGAPVAADPPAARRRGIGVVWQDLALCDNLDIAANLMLGRERRRQLFSDIRMHGDAGRLLAQLGIPLPDTSRSVRQLSGGQRQLVAVARAMAHRPRLLLLDEPTASLGVREGRLVEELIIRLREQGTTIVLACHDISQMFRLADRIAVLRHGRFVAEVAPSEVHPDDVVALLSGQQITASARHQLTRLHGLADQLATSDASSSLPLILSALGTALGSDHLCIHLLENGSLSCAASLGLPARLQAAWSRLPCGPAGGPAGMAARTEQPVVAENARSGSAWEVFGNLARDAKVASSWSVPVLGRDGPLGVITVLRAIAGKPQRDDLDLATLYAGYAASAIERDRLLAQVTARNRVLETIREVLQTLAGPVPVADGLSIALQALSRGLQADEAALVVRPAGNPAICRAHSGLAEEAPGPRMAGDRRLGGDLLAGEPVPPAAARRAVTAAQAALALADGDGSAMHHQIGADGGRLLSVTFGAPGGLAVLVARWSAGAPPGDAPALLEDAAHSLQLALEREEAWFAHQEAMTLRRSQELQRGFLSRLSHELRTPLTAIRGYASSLLQPDVTWDADSQQRFIGRIAAESTRLGRLVDDLLDFSAIESGILRLQRDWCDLPLVIDAAVACLPPASARLVAVDCAADLPVIWADHDRLEQVFVNLLGNAFGHNPPGTRVRVSVTADGPAGVVVSVTDDGAGMPAEVTLAPFEPMRRHRTAGGGSGLGLSITRGIVAAHGGRIELSPAEPAGHGTCVRIHLPVEVLSPAVAPADLAGRSGGQDRGVPGPVLKVLPRA